MSHDLWGASGDKKRLKTFDAPERYLSLTESNSIVVQSVSPCVCLSLYLSAYLFLCLSVCPSVRPSFRSSFCPDLCKIACKSVSQQARKQARTCVCIYSQFYQFPICYHIMYATYYTFVYIVVRERSSQAHVSFQNPYAIIVREPRVNRASNLARSRWGPRGTCARARVQGMSGVQKEALLSRTISPTIFSDDPWQMPSWLRNAEFSQFHVKISVRVATDSPPQPDSLPAPYTALPRSSPSIVTPTL